MSTVDCIKEDTKVREPLSELELMKMRKFCKNEKERALLELFYSTGCRVSEVVNMNIADVDFENRQIKVFGKGRKERIVFFSAPAYFYLKEYLQTRDDDNEALFVSERKPHGRIKKTGLEKIIKEIGKRSITRNVFCHLLRHTCACYLLSHGMTIDQIQVLLGHEDIGTTRHYAKTDMTQLRYAYRLAMVA